MKGLPHRLLDRMSAATRAQLEADVREWGPRLEGRSLLEVAEATAWRSAGGRPTDRAERLHAWLLRHAPAASAPVASPEAAQPVVDEMLIERWDDAAPRPATGFTRVPHVGDEEEPIEAILSRSEAAFREKSRRAEAAMAPRVLRMPPGPYAIAHFGDDHLDDDGCDLPGYRAAIRIVASTPGFYGGAVGDLPRLLRGQAL